MERVHWGFPVLKGESKEIDKVVNVYDRLLCFGGAER
jgi:hypothetical protein